MSKCLPEILFSVFLRLTLAGAVLLLGGIGCDPLPLPTQGTVQAYKAHLNQNATEGTAGGSDKT